MSLRGATSTWLVLAGVVLVGCGGGSIPPPEQAALDWADAAARGDADRLHALLSTKGQQQLTRDEVRALVAAQRPELTEQAALIRSAQTRIETEATVAYGDGEHAELALERGEFRLRAADALPAEPRTPVQALEHLRRVLARRSYAGLVRVLSPRTRAAVEEDLRSLVEGLERPDGLDVQVSGDTAVVDVPGGHLVRLRREGGVWHVEDFD